jgi:hypothetical protein
MSPDIIWLALDDEELLDGDVNEKHQNVFSGQAIKTESRVHSTLPQWASTNKGKS